MSRFCISFLFTLLVSTSFAQPKTDAYKLGVEGVLKVDEGEYKEGIALLKQARNLAPKEYDYSFEIGKAYLKSGDPKKAEKYLFPLQYHADVQADLYVLLSICYRELNEAKKTPDPTRKKELDMLRYGIQKLPTEGLLYLTLGKRNLELEKPIEALAILESGIRKAPNFAENYYWAAKLMMASGNEFWAWIYAETFFNMTDDQELQRSAAILITESTRRVFAKGWKNDPEKLDQSVMIVLSESCVNDVVGIDSESVKRACLMENWDYASYSLAPLFDRLKLLNERGWLGAYVASISETTNKEAFLEWVPNNAKAFEAYRNWRYWNALVLKAPVQRLID